MSRAALVLSSVPFLFVVACTSSDRSHEVQSTEARVLRDDLTLAGITPVTAETPDVSADLFELGQALFFDKALSSGEDVSCATCHLPGFAAADGRTLSSGVHGLGFGPDRAGGEMLGRNSPSLIGVHARKAMFWDGAVEEINGFVLGPQTVRFDEEARRAFTPGLEVMAAQAMLPPVSRREMRGFQEDGGLGQLPDGYGSPLGQPENTRLVWDALMERLLDMPGYLNRFRSAYPDVAVEDLDFGHAGNALAAFEATGLARMDSPFDRFMRGDDQALTRAQARGARAFLSAGCAECHTGPLLTDEDYHNTALPQIGPGTRFEPTTVLTVGGPDVGRENVTRIPTDRFKFKTPSLLNVELTAPYGHSGQFAKLEDMVAHYEDVAQSNLLYDIVSNVDDPRIVPMHALNSDEVLRTVDPLIERPREIDVDAIVDFLGSLTADEARDLSAVIPLHVPSGLPVL